MDSKKEAKSASEIADEMKKKCYKLVDECAERHCENDNYSSFISQEAKQISDILLANSSFYVKKDAYDMLNKEICNLLFLKIKDKQEVKKVEGVISNSKFKIGDVVRHKGSDIKMVVFDITTFDITMKPLYECSWIFNGNRNKAGFMYEELILVESNQPLDKEMD